jgi:hypothetical protein
MGFSLRKSPSISPLSAYPEELEFFCDNEKISENVLLHTWSDCPALSGTEYSAKHLHHEAASVFPSFLHSVYFHTPIKCER